jgi:hypothetical protein
LLVCEARVLFQSLREILTHRFAPPRTSGKDLL